MGRVEPAQHLARLLLIAQHQRQHQIHRALQAQQRILPEPAMGGHSRRDQRMRQLQQQRPPPAEHQRRLARQPAQDTVRRKQGRVGHRPVPDPRLVLSSLPPLARRNMSFNHAIPRL